MWPLSVWTNMLDIATINTWILYRKSTNKGITRENFLLKLIDTLRHKQIEISPEILTAFCNQLSTKNCKKCKGSYGCGKYYSFAQHYLQRTKDLVC